MSNLSRFLFPLVAALLAVGCGGGGGGVSAGIDRLGVTTGSINGFGSVIVNGVHYDTTGASFTVDDNPGGQDDLAVGQVVTIEWESDDNGVTFSARTLVYDDSVEGRITAISLAAGTFEVLGQTVRVDDGTSFDSSISPGALSSLAVNDIVEVSGLPDSLGVIRATRIERKSVLGELEVRGNIGSIAGSTFTINNLTVNTASVAGGFQDCPGGQLAVGALVEAKGTTLNAQNQLVATEVECESGDLPGGSDDGDDGEIEGYVTQFTSLASFQVNGVPVSTSASTVFDDGVAADLGLDDKVEVKGLFDANGVLQASRIEFRSGGSDTGDDADQARIEADVASTNLQANTLVVAGVTVQVDELTRFEDKSNAEVAQFDLGDIGAGDFLKINGVEIAGNVVRALIVEREDADAGDNRRLEGPVDSINAGTQTLNVLGKDVIVNGSTQYRGIADEVLTANQFFSAVAAGDVVAVEFAINPGNPIVARELEIEFMPLN